MARQLLSAADGVVPEPYASTFRCWNFGGNKLHRPVSMRFMKTRMISGAALLFLTLATLPNGGLAAGQQVQAPKDIVLSIDSLGDLRLDDQRIEFPALTRQLQEISRSGSGSAVVVAAARDARYSDVVKLIDTARAAGIKRVGLRATSVLSLDRAGAIRLDGTPINLADVTPRVRNLVKDSDRTIFVQAYGSLPFETVLDVVNAARAGGATQITLVKSE
jgi:biopolymer transport protein ExbD